MEESQAAGEVIRRDEDVPAVLDEEKRGDIPHIEKEDARSETSGVISVSDVESTFAEFEDVKYVRIPCPSPHPHIYKPDFQTWRDRPQTLGEDRHHLGCRVCHVSFSNSSPTAAAP